jgi:hypothetical protein
MESQTDWRSHVREPKDIPSRPDFTGRSADEPTTGHAESWTSPMNEDAREMPLVPAYLQTAAIAAVAAGTGLAVGYWLGGRRAKRSRWAFSLSNSDLSDFARLAPEAAHLLKNPVVRALAARVVMKQLSRYLTA